LPLIPGITHQRYGYALELGPANPEGDMIAPGGGEAQPAGELQQLGEHPLIQFQVRELALAAEGAQVDFVRGEVLRIAIIRVRDNTVEGETTWVAWLSQQLYQLHRTRHIAFLKRGVYMEK